MNVSFDIVTKYTDVLKTKYGGIDPRWDRSPFLWIKTASSRKSGKVGEDIVRMMMTCAGSKVLPSIDTKHDLRIDGKKCEVKLSTLNESDGFIFNALAEEGYDEICLLGIEPFRIRLWKITKDIGESVWRKQHRGGDATFWILFQNDNVPANLDKFKIVDIESSIPKNN